MHNDGGQVPKKVEKKEEKIVEIKKEIASDKIETRPKYTRRESPVITPPLEEVIDDFVPLKELKAKSNVVNSANGVNNGKKVVSEKSLSELRAVLQSLNKNKDKPKGEIPTENKIKEIPENELKKMLEI